MMQNNLRLIAVGSNPLVATELHNILRSILSFKIPIAEAKTKDITAVEPDTFYICANTQGAALAKFIPANKLFVFDLTPTTTFFLDIAKIPAGESVLVFNNLSEYAELLIRKCYELGINKLNFEPAAYEELSEAVLQEKLSAARYIIGVEAFTGTAVLQSETYKAYLRPDVKIISGQRTASVASANRLLLAISEYYYLAFSATAAKLAKEQGQTTSLSELSQNLDKLITGLQQSVLQTVTFQITGAQSQANKHKRELEIETCTAATYNTIKMQLEQLEFLKEKISRLTH